jgi:hypothetical protein
MKEKGIKVEKEDNKKFETFANDADDDDINVSDDSREVID